MSADLKALGERVKAATGADRRIDALIFAALDNPTGVLFMDEKPDSPKLPGHIKPYTASVDAALALVERVLPGWCASAIKLVGHAEAYVWPGEGPQGVDGYLFQKQGTGPTPALALLSALLSALASEEGGQHQTAEEAG